ncbi:conserved hypothetical protein [Methanolacinia petrolearia DSM 11571]|uniref:Uncharacterized protein n=1 Tax=Methanolacinia petrolearia (strain DSM 11571 / OCM 486 / SEBR 4847) TaxID=679926 RepID=E1RH05_METP4|nr:hypothetical protein [Methanolacinia petrolearia]ADN35229.1 conserved hypothetical protein [Methanolacinia petrolearia DSM 11571]
MKKTQLIGILGGLGVLLIVMAICLYFAGPVPDNPDNFQANERGSVTFYYNNGGSQISLDLSALKVDDPETISTNLSTILGVALNDLRSGILLENGWIIASVSEYDNEDSNDGKSVELEFRKDALSFYIVVNEQSRTATKGYCDAITWISEPISGPLPEGYHKAKDKLTGWWYVFDIQNNSSNSTVVMIYNDTAILYLYPSYSVINTEGLYD